MTHSLNAKPLPVCGARLLGRVMKVAAPPGGCALDVDVDLWPARGSHADPRLRGDARGRDKPDFAKCPQSGASRKRNARYEFFSV